MQSFFASNVVLLSNSLNRDFSFLMCGKQSVMGEMTHKIASSLATYYIMSYNKENFHDNLVLFILLLAGRG